MGSLKHPNIVTLYGVCYHRDGSNAVSIVEELAERDLLDAVWELRERGSTLPFEWQVKYALDIARGVAHMDAQGKVHCDLK